MKAGDRVKIDFIGESATIYSGKRFTGYGVLDRVEDGRVFGRLDDGTPFMCLCADVEVIGMSEIQGKKLDQNKPRMSLLPKGALNAVIRVLEFGATKYQVDNWRHVPDAKTRYYDAMQRHIDAWWQGEQKDPETGEHHLAHAICCGMFLWWFDNQQSGVPEAILEVEKKLCHHHWVDGLDGGTMICTHKCGAWK